MGAEFLPAGDSSLDWSQLEWDQVPEVLAQDQEHPTVAQEERQHRPLGRAVGAHLAGQERYVGLASLWIDRYSAEAVAAP